MCILYLKYNFELEMLFKSILQIVASCRAGDDQVLSIVSYVSHHIYVAHYWNP